MIIAAFREGIDYTTATGLWQWDYGQVLRIQGLKLPMAVEVHFSQQAVGGDSKIFIGVTKDGVTDVPIPDFMLREMPGDNIYAFIYLFDENSGETIKKIIMPVEKRPKPEAFNTHEDAELFREAIAAVNESAERAGESEASAEAWAHGHEDYPNRDTDNAKYYADVAEGNAQQTGDDLAEVQRIAESVAIAEGSISADKEAVAELREQAQAAAENALLSEQSAKASEAAAQEAQAGAEAAQATAELYAGQVEADKDTVEQAKALVMELGQEVADNKSFVEETAGAFANAAQQAVGDVNNAGQAQVERVENTGTQAVNDVTVAQTQAVKAVNDAGAQQVSAVTQEGAAQVANVENAVADIIADRDQIEINRQNILKNVISSTAAGEHIALTDSADYPFRGMWQYGRTTQDSTTGAQLFDVNLIQGRTVNGITFDVLEDGGIHAYGTSTGQAYTAPVMIDLPAGTYFVSGSNSNVTFYISTREKDSSGSWKEQNNTVVTVTETDDVRAYVNVNTNTTVNAIIYPMLNLGETALPWEPYTGGRPSPNPDYPQEIVNAGDKGSIVTTVAGKNLFGGLIKGVSINSTTGAEGSSTVCATSDYIRFDTEQKYYLSGLVNSLYSFVAAYTKDKKFVGRTTGAARESIALQINSFMNARTDIDASEIRYIRITQYESAVTTGVINDVDTAQIQLEIGDEPTAYESPVIQTIAISTPDGLPGIPVSSGGNYTDENGQQWIADYRDWGRGKDIKTIKTKLFDGSENWEWISPTFYAYISDMKKKSNILCTHYIASLDHKYSGLITTSRGAGVSVWINDSRFDGDVEAFKAFISQNPFTVYYTLATPVETDIPAEELAAYHALHTNHINTSIFNDEDVHTEVDYAVDTKTYIDNKFDELQNAILSMGGGA